MKTFKIYSICEKVLSLKPFASSWRLFPFYKKTQGRRNDQIPSGKLIPAEPLCLLRDYYKASGVCEIQSS